MGKYICSLRKSKFFKKVAKDLDINEDDLAKIQEQVENAAAARGVTLSDEETIAAIKEVIKDCTVKYTDKSLYDAVAREWEKPYVNHGYIVIDENDFMSGYSWYHSRLAEAFGEDNLYTYRNSKGELIIRVAKPVYKDSSDTNDTASEEKTTTDKKDTSTLVDMLTESIAGTSENEINTLEQAATIVEMLKAYSKKHIVFNKEDHSYKVDGKAAHTTVTQFIYGKGKDIGPIGVPSSALGNTGDAITRDFFMGTLKEKYPNMSKEGLEVLIDNLKKFQKMLDKKFGGRKNYRVVTDEFYIAAKYTIMKNGKPVTKKMAGSMDMLIYDNKGNFYIYDMKVKRSGVSKQDKENYSKQLSLYKAILEANFPQLKGKIKELKVIPFNTYYAYPEGYRGGKVKYKVDKETNTLYADNIPIEENPNVEYTQPNLDITSLEGLVTLDMKEFKEEFEAMDSFDRELLMEEIGDVQEGRKDEYEPTSISEQKNLLYNNPLLTAEERAFLAQSLMRMTSLKISHLQKYSWALKNMIKSLRDTGTETSIRVAERLEQYLDTDFTSMSRSDIVKTIGINNIFDWVKEAYFNSDNREDIENESTLDKLDLVYSNWEALKQEGYAELIMLEDVTVIQADQVIKEGIDEQLRESMDAGAEQHEREYWQVHFRQISAMAGLSTRIRREFARLQIRDLDLDGAPVCDDVFGMPMYVDPGVAVASILEWVKDCNTLSEMEKVLGELVEYYPWLATIVGYHKNGLDIDGLIEEEPFRSQFFSNFRKDFTEYSTVLVEVDDMGNRKYKTHIINTKGATKFLMDQVVNSFQEGALPEIIVTIKGDIEGRGKVNINTVKLIFKEWEKLKKTLDNCKSKDTFNRTLQKNVPLINSWLNTLGIMTTDQNLEGLFLSDYNGKKTYRGSRAAEVMTKIQHILNTLIAHKDDNAYNPMLKGRAGNLYNDYKDIIEMVSKFVQDGIEASSYENGRMYYSFQTPSYMGKLISNLKDALKDKESFEKFVEENYKKYRWFYSEEGDDLLSEGEWLNTWLNELMTSSTNREALDHKVQLSFDGTDYRDLSEVGYTLSLMSEFFYHPDANWAWYRMPILSNKPSSEFIKFKRYHRKFKEAILPGLVNVANQEILRMRTVLDTIGTNLATNWSISKKIIDKNPNLVKKIKDRKKLEEDLSKGKISEKEYNRKIKSTYLTFNDLVKGGKLVTSGSGAEFKFLEALNNELINKTDLGQMILDRINGIEYSVDQHSDFVDALKVALEEDMNVIVSQEVEQWKKIGLFEMEEQQYEFTEGEGRNKKTVRVTLPRYKYLQSYITSPSAIYERMAKKSAYKNRFDKKGNLTKEFLADFQKNMEDEIMRALEEYVWNDLFATINIIELTATDLAYFKNVEDFQKRYAAVHSPGLRLNTEATFIQDGVETRYSDGICRVMHIADIMDSSDVIENVRKVFEDVIRKEKDSNKKAELKKMFDLILNDFKSFNITDGQGYSSPTSYRKKMGMMGRWSEAEERAYQNIVNGNFNVEDLSIIWQPLKPFIYTQLNRTTGSDIMSEVKVPMQVKDSEYMLLLADAIMRGGRRQNKLTALFDFMEDSAYNGRVSDNGKVLNSGTYNGKGIDTVAFVSTSKFGASEVVDLSDDAIEAYRSKYPKKTKNMSDYKVMKTMLEEAAYYNSEHTDDEDNNGGRYNDSYVHEFGYEDYAIQQEVPDHLMDHEQAMGSQIRILSISDISDDDIFHIGKKSINGQELVKEYQELIAKNIKASFDELIDAFHLKAKSKFERNKALERILREAILKDQRYGDDLLRACTLNDLGEFTIPLSDPVQSTRIQQLLNSIIKSRINKQKVKGGPVVQTSVFGMSDDLSIRFKDKNGNMLMTFSEFKEAHKYTSDEDAVAKFREYLQKNQGELAYWEIYAPVPSEAMERALIEAGKRNGKDYFNNVDEAVKDGIIDEEMLKCIGYRIPTEDKYSMAPMRIKGFMPRAAGEALMMPKEVTLLTGSDFDIDKMYLMFKDFDVKRFSIHRLDVSKENKNAILDEIARLHPELVKKVAPITDNTFSQDQLYEIFGEIYDENPELKQALSSLRMMSGEYTIRDKRVTDKNGNTRIKKVTDWEHSLNYYFTFYPDSPAGMQIQSMAKAAGFTDVAAYKNHLVLQAAAKLDMSPEIVEVKKRGYLAMDDESIDKAGLTKYQVFKEAADNLGIPLSEKIFNPKFTERADQETTEGRNNRIFDLQWASLTGESTLSKMFNPGSFNVQKKTARIVTILKDPNNKYSYEQLADMDLDTLSDKAEAATGKNILRSTTQVYFHKQNMTAGKLIGIFANNNTSHAFISLQDVHLKLDSKSAFMFDGSTLINTDRLDNLYARDGKTLISKNIAGFLAASVDAVKDPVLNFLNLNTFTAGAAMVLIRLGFDVDSVGLFLTQPIVEKTVSEYFKRSNEGYVSQDTIIEDMKEFLKTEYKKDSKVAEENLTTTSFEKKDMGKYLKVDLNNMNSSEAEFQMEVLVLLQKLLRIANQMNTMTFLTKFNSVTNAPGPTIADSLVMRERYSKFKKLFDDGLNLLSDSALKVVDNSPILKAFYDATVADDGASKLVFDPHFPHYSISFTHILDSLTSIMKSSPDAKLINSLVSDYMLYKFTAGDNPVIDMSYKNREFYIHDFVKTFNSNASLAPNNALLKIMQLKARTSKCPVPTLETRTGSFNTAQQENIRNAWSTLIKNPETKDFATQLFFYNIIRSGFIFSPKTFGHLASVDIKLAIDGYVDALRDTRFNDDEVDISMDAFLYQFLRNHADNTKLVPKVKEDRRNLKTSTSSKDKTITFTFNKDKVTPAFLIESNKLSIEKFSPVIWYKGQLYMAPDYFEEDGKNVSITYTRTTTLGNTNNFLEYNANLDEGGAFLESAMRRGVSKSTISKEDEKEKNAVDDEDDGDSSSSDGTVTKDSGDDNDEVESYIERWNRLSKSDEDYLLDLVFTDPEMIELQKIQNGGGNVQKRAIELVVKHLEQSRKPEKSSDKKFRNKLEEIATKLCI